MIVVSNRVAPVDEGKASAGGLAIAVLEALKETGGIWFGWSGEVTEDPPEEPSLNESDSVTYATIDLAPQDHQDYYNGYANATLWPLFHFRLDLAEFNARTRDAWRRVNRLFAERLAPMLQGDDVVWIHDYHLIPMGAELRRMGFRQKIGFFLHTPFPPPEILVALPGHEDLIRSLCAYDVVGFHTREHLRGFTEYILHEAGGEVREDGRVFAHGRWLKALACPISIDLEQMVGAAASAERARQSQRLRESLVGRDLIVGVDRLDYSKGLPQRFEAIERMLSVYPQTRGRVVFLQIAPPSRGGVKQYRDLRVQLERAAGHINGRFAEFDWNPIRYLNKSFSRSSLAGFYRMARIGLVTPLRDGMNLVAKEYVASQDPEDPGVLVLSRFAGAALELDAALIVNPYDVEGVAGALQKALQMPLDERRERHAAMMDVLRTNDISAWRRRFVEALRDAPYGP